MQQLRRATTRACEPVPRTAREGAAPARSGARRRRFAALVAIAVTAPTAGAVAQPAVVEAPAVTVDTTSLAPDPGVVMETLLEKTIFKVDVLRLRLRFGESTATRLRELMADGAGRPTPDSLAAVALASTDVWARIRFERDVSMSQFLDGILDNLERALEAGIVPETEFERLDDALPRWFGFLRERRVRDGDELWYRIRGDTLRTLYIAVDGTVLLDQTDVGPGPRLAVLGGYFAPGSDLRDGLIESLLERPRVR